jgi:hypothetical protein
VQALCEVIPAGADVAVREFEAAAEEFVSCDDVGPVDGDAGQAAPAIRLRDGRLVWARTDQRFSTVELMTVERDVIETALAGASRGAAIAEPREVEAALSRRRRRSRAQSAAIRRYGHTVRVPLGQLGRAELSIAEGSLRSGDVDLGPDGGVV